MRTAKKKTVRRTTPRRVRESGADYGQGHGEVVLYRAPDGTVSFDVRLERDTIWLSLKQMALLFGRDKSVISRHLRNVFNDNELERNSVVAFYATTAADGKTYDVEHFNLDAIISVGYRVNLKHGTQFRIWATTVLRDHIEKGYSVNERRLGELQLALRLVTGVAGRSVLTGDEASALLQVVGEYSFALDLLDDYDHQRVRHVERPRAEVLPVTTDEARRAVERLREKYHASEIFGREKDDGLAGALAAMTLLIAGSRPKEKDALMRVFTHLLAGE